VTARNLLTGITDSMQFEVGHDTISPNYYVFTIHDNLVLSFYALNPAVRYRHFTSIIIQQIYS